MVPPRRLLAAALILLLLVPSAAAHAVLQSSIPSKGSRLAAAPTFVSITLTEPADPDGTSLKVVDAQDRRVDLDDLDITPGNNPTLRVSLPDDLPDGAYRIVWQALSGADGHTTRGTVGFAVGDFAPPDSQASSIDNVAWLGAAGRFLAFLGLAIALGAALFLAWVPGAVAVPRRPVLEALLLGAALHVIGVACLLKSTLDQTQLSVTGLAATAVGKTLLLRIGLALGATAFAAIAALPRMPARMPPYLAVALLVASGLGSARFGHASLAGLNGIVVDALHLFAAAAWVGGLLVYLWVLGEADRASWGADQVRLAGVRFGTAALACVILLLGAGVGTSLAILGGAALLDPVALVSTSWGSVLAAKVVLTLGMLGIAIGNRYGILEPARERGFAARVQRAMARVAPGLRSLEPRGGGLHRLVRVEATLGVLVLALAGVLTSISPAAGTAPAQEPLSVTGFGSEFHGELTADPRPAVGASSTVTVRIETHDGVAIEDNTCGRTAPQSCVSAVFGAGPGGETHALQPVGGGDWRVEGILWTVAGPTNVTVSVATAEVFEDRMTFQFVVA